MLQIDPQSAGTMMTPGTTPPPLTDRIPSDRYARWLDNVFGVFDAFPDLPPLDAFDLSPFGSSSHGFGTDEICAATIQTFERADRDLAQFSDRALACGLKVLVDPIFSDLVRHLRCRTDVLAAFGDLYSKSLSVRSPAVLGSLSEPTDPASADLGTITYMLWDITSLNYWPDNHDHQTFVPTFLDMLERVIMTNDNPACIESALHGIGHVSGYGRHLVAASYADGRRAQIIDAFLAKRRTLRPELLDYARAARTGMIL
jgi:hypothetical protein